MQVENETVELIQIVRNTMYMICDMLYSILYIDINFDSYNYDIVK